MNYTVISEETVMINNCTRLYDAVFAELGSAANYGILHYNSIITNYGIFFHHGAGINGNIFSKHCAFRNLSFF